MPKPREYPKSEGEIRAQQEILQKRVERKMELQSSILERLKTSERLMAEVLIARSQAEAVQKKIENLSRLASSSGDQERFAEAMEKTKQELESATSVLQEAERKVRELETEVLILAAELAAIDKEKEESQASIKELIRLVEERIAEKLKSPDEQIAKLGQEIEALKKQIQERIKKLQEEYHELTGHKLSLSSNPTEAVLDREKGWISNDALKETQAHSTEEHDLRGWLKRAKNLDYGTKRQQYTPEQVIKGELVSDVRQMAEEAQQALSEHQKKKPGAVSMFFTGGGEWSKKLLQLETRVRETQTLLEHAQRKEEQLKKEFEQRQEKIKTHKKRGIGLREIADEVAQISRMTNSRVKKEREIEQTNEYKTRMTRDDRNQIWQLEGTLRELGIDIKHPLMQRIKDTLEERTKKEKQAEAA